MLLIERTAGAITVALVMVIGFQAADLTWRFFKEAGTLASSPPAEVPDLVGTRSANRDLAGITELHLFGEVSRPAERVRVVSAPKTNLSLILRGVVRLGDPGEDVAIIADSNGNERPYGIGDQVPGDAKLSEIHPYRVLLERNGRVESLNLIKQEVENRPQEINPAGRNDKASRIGRMPRSMALNPAELSKYLNLVPVNAGGRLKGYRVSPQGKSTLFRDAGLQKGDVVTRVNGKAVSDPDLLQGLVQQLGSTDEIVLDLVNGRRRRRLSIHLE